jgi:hypothetical protein
LGNWSLENENTEEETLTKAATNVKEDQHHQQFYKGGPSTHGQEFMATFTPV